MAEAINVVARWTLLRRRPAAAGAALTPCAAFRNPLFHAASSSGDGAAEAQVKGKEKWFTLPPFSSTVDASSLGKKLETGSDAATPTISTTTALKWVLRCCPQLPRSLVHKLFRIRQVRRECPGGGGGEDSKLKNPTQWCQLKRVAGSYTMNQGERIYLPITVSEPPIKSKQELHCTEEEISIVRGLELHKDSAIIAINKPPGLPVQGGLGIKRSLDELAATCLRYDYSEPPKLVHRLDKDCSGILVMGRTPASTAVLHSIFREKTVGASDNAADGGKRILQKRYLALVLGTPKRLKGLVSAPLAKVMVDNGKSERITISDNATSCHHAVTEYRVIESFDGFSWLELSPLTGRKHQLRLHCAEVLGTPIVGDYKYGLRAHQKWKQRSPQPHIKTTTDDRLYKEEMLGGLCRDLARGSLAEKRPHLHLHCKQMILPDISLVLEETSRDPDFDVSQLESLNLVAPLPFHMQRSWDILNSATTTTTTRD
ncbi:hypothetical protein Dimus_025960 [Dionaea muscipula]